MMQHVIVGMQCYNCTHSSLYLTDDATCDSRHAVLALYHYSSALWTYTYPVELPWVLLKITYRHNKYNERNSKLDTGKIYTWWGLCRYVVDVEDDSFVKDGLVEDLMEGLVIGYDLVSNEEDDMSDNDGRELMHNALQDLTRSTETCRAYEREKTQRTLHKSKTGVGYYIHSKTWTLTIYWQCSTIPQLLWQTALYTCTTKSIPLMYSALASFFFTSLSSFSCSTYCGSSCNLFHIQKIWQAFELALKVLRSLLFEGWAFIGIYVHSIDSSAIPWGNSLRLIACIYYYA